MQKYNITTLRKCDLKQFSTDDLQTLSVKLSLHNRNTAAIVHAAGGKVTSGPGGVDGEFFENATALIANVKLQLDYNDNLLSELGGAANVVPSFEFSAGFTPGGEQARSAATENRRPGASAKSGQTLTGRVLALRGVKTIDELNAKMKAEENNDDGDGEDDEKRDDDDGDPQRDKQTEPERTSLTGKILKARGVKTLAELNALPPRNIGD